MRRERKTKAQLSYGEKLRDPRWQKKRLEAMHNGVWRCADCGAVDEELHVHHNFYLKDMEPWDYSVEQFTILCHLCHKKATQNHRALKEALSRLRSPSHGFVIGFVNGLSAEFINDIPCTCEDEATGIAVAFSSIYRIPVSRNEVMALVESDGTIKSYRLWQFHARVRRSK